MSVTPTRPEAPGGQGPFPFHSPLHPRRQTQCQPRVSSQMFTQQVNKSLFHGTLCAYHIDLLK